MDQRQVVSGTRRTLYLSSRMALETGPDSEFGIRVAHKSDMRGQLTHTLQKIDWLLEQVDMSRSNIVFVRFSSTDSAAFLENYDVYANWIGEGGVLPP